MDKMAVEELLKQNGIEEIEEIPYKKNLIVLRFYYDFDDDEIEAARAYANDESGEDEEAEKWTEQFFLPYLSDISVDNVGEIIESVMETTGLAAQFISYDIDEEDYGYSEFIAVFAEDTEEIDIESIMDDLNL